MILEGILTLYTQAGRQTYVQLTTQIVMLLLVHSTIRLFLLVLPEIEEGLT